MIIALFTLFSFSLNTRMGWEITIQGSIQFFKNKWWVFPTKITTRVIVNVANHGWVTRKIFHFRLSKMPLNSISFTCVSCRKTSDLHLILEDPLKRIALQNCVKISLKINYVVFPIHIEKDHLCFYKNSTNQAFAFIHSKKVHFKKHLHYQVQHHWKTKFPLPLNVLYHHLTIKLAVRALVKPLYTCLKDVFRNTLLGVFEKTVEVMGQSEVKQLTVNKRNQLVGLILH